MSRILALALGLSFGCAPTILPTPQTGPTTPEGMKPIKESRLASDAAPKVPVQPRLPKEPLVTEASFTVEGAWAQHQRLLLRVDDPEAVGGKAWLLLNLEEGDEQGEEITRQSGAPVLPVPDAGVLIFEGESRDIAMSVEDGQPLAWKAETPDGTVTDEGLRLLAHPDGGSVWFVLPWHGELLAGRRGPDDGDVVAVGHRLPWMPLAVTSPVDDDALGWNPQHSSSAVPEDCPYLTLPAVGGPTCVPRGADVPTNQLRPLSEGWWAVLPGLGVVRALHVATGRQVDLFAESDGCVEGVVFEGALQRPPRLLASCRKDQARVELRLWSPKTTWSWMEYIHPAPSSSVTVADHPVVGFGEPDSERLTWVDLEGALRIETPRLTTPGGGRSMPAVFFGLEQGEMGKSLYSVDMHTKTLQMWGLVLDCDGELNFTAATDHTLLECWERSLVWSEVLYADGRYVRAKGKRVEAVLPERLLVSDRLSTSATGKASNLWVLPTVDEPEEEEE